MPLLTSPETTAASLRLRHYREAHEMIVWEIIASNMDDKNLRCQRAKVPGGWLVLVTYHSSAFVNFVPDPEHQWNADEKE